MKQQTFHLQRDEDFTGVSGTGKVAEGCVFSDGRVALRWVVGDFHTTVEHDSIDSVAAIHSHDGRTKIVWHDENRPTWVPDYVPPAGQ